MKDKILRYLKATNEYVSGQKLCDALNVSRTAIWKAINQLKEEGYIIEAVKNKGYCLINAPDLITDQEIYSLLDTDWAARNIYYREVMSSTNQVAKILAEEGAVHGTLVTAEMQEGGKGRRGRVWHSPKGSGIWMSMILRPDIFPEHASMLTIVAALAVYEVIAARVEHCMIKWPNDLIINGKKICGILTEMSTEIDKINYVVLGIGINVHTETFEDDIKDIATSLKKETGLCYNRSQLIADIWKTFEKYYDTFLKTEDLSEMVELYERHLLNMNQEVYIEERGKIWTGIARGIDQDGCLKVEMPDGMMRHVMSGEVSVRGILGYR